jgi:hypothetical protein
MLQRARNDGVEYLPWATPSNVMAGLVPAIHDLFVFRVAQPTGRK